MKIYVVGSKEFVQGFLIIGIKDVFSVSTTKEFLEVFNDLMEREDAGLIIVDDVFFKDVPGFVKEEVERRTLPVVIGFDINKGYLDETTVKDLIKKSLGVDVEL